MGIAGIDLSKNDFNMMYHLLYFDTLRGRDSTGIAFVSNKDEVEIFKCLGESDNLYIEYDKKFPLPINTKVMIGHNRAATKGLVNVENAHPFHIGNVVGAHNGTILEYQVRKLHEHNKYQVDSQALFSQINHTSVEDLWEKCDGAMALTWWDTTTSTLHFARNKDRPLHYALSEDNKKIFWASESWMIIAASIRTGVKIGGLKSVVIDKHYTISFKEKSLEVEETTLPPFKYPITTYGRGNWSEWYSAWMGTETVDEKTKKSGKDNVDYGYKELQFWIDSWEVGVIDGATGKPRTGYFLGSISGGDHAGEDIKISVVDYNNEVQKIIDNLELYDETNLYITEKAWVGPSINKKSNMFHTGFPTIRVLASYKTTLGPSSSETTTGFNGEELTLNEWLNRTSCGCDNCTKNLAWHDRLSMKWLSPKSVLCADCAALPGLPAVA